MLKNKKWKKYEKKKLNFVVVHVQLSATRVKTFFNLNKIFWLIIFSFGSNPNNEIKDKRK
ncbi:hypothetical protein BLOT_000983 [Blomia tropicalis]|nr:hypothetical protein BLOT_000983 [Blomia tropicalis]